MKAGKWWVVWGFPRVCISASSGVNSVSQHNPWSACMIMMHDQHVCVTECLAFHFGFHINRLGQPHSHSEQRSSIISLIFFMRRVSSKNRPEIDLWIFISSSCQRVTAVSASVSAEHVTDVKKSSKGVKVHSLSFSLSVLGKGKTCCYHHY